MLHKKTKLISQAYDCSQISLISQDLGEDQYPLKEIKIIKFKRHRDLLLLLTKCLQAEVQQDPF